MSYGVEARDPTQPEWLNVERFCKFVMGGGSIRYAIQLVLGAVRKLAEGKVSLEETHLPMDPRAWLEVLYERERETAPEGLRRSTFVPTGSDGSAACRCTLNIQTPRHG